MGVKERVLRNGNAVMISHEALQAIAATAIDICTPNNIDTLHTRSTPSLYRRIHKSREVLDGMFKLARIDENQAP